MSLVKSEGIVLKSIDFRENDRIITLFTQDHGVVKLMVHRARRKKHGPIAVSTPLTQAEYVYQERKGEIFLFKEASMMNAHLQLRNNYAHLETACALVRAVEKTQETGTPAPQLYQLLRYLLEKIPQTEYPERIIPVFHLRILKHDGWLADRSSCAVCGEILQENYYHFGEEFCHDHRDRAQIRYFSDEEMALIQVLAGSRSFQELTATEIPEKLAKKICQTNLQR